jgi:hypothetical protein
MAIDLNAARALRDEASNQPHTVVFGDPPKEFQIPRTKRWDPEHLELAIDGRVASAFRRVMGDEQYEQFRALGPDLEDYETLFEQLTAAEGIDVGNSERSSRSSRSTPQQSRRTSPATTG